MIRGQITYTVESGSMSYVGDLTPLSSSWSFSNPKFYISNSLGIPLNNFLSGNIKFTYGSIEGDDADSQDLTRRKRNLSFKSNIYEYGIGVQFDINRMLLSSLDKYGVRLYYNTGINLYSFKPMAYYDNEWVDLKPLNTECQSCNDIPDREPYSLTQINIPFGFGFDFFLSEKVKMGFDWTQRLLFTDYLDDVSKTYVDQNVLTDRFGSLSASLADRRGELPGGSTIDNTGNARGNPENNDGYFTLGVKFTFYLSSPKVVALPDTSEEKIIPEE